MGETEILRKELQELTAKLSGPVSFSVAMQISARIKALELQITLAEAGKPKEEPREYVPGGRATEMRQAKPSNQSRWGGHDPYKVLFPDR